MYILCSSRFTSYNKNNTLHRSRFIPNNKQPMEHLFNDRNTVTVLIQLESKVGNILVKAEALCINLKIDDPPTYRS
jgi:hypothetical protein